MTISFPYGTNTKITCIHGVEVKLHVFFVSDSKQMETYSQPHARAVVPSGGGGVTTYPFAVTKRKPSFTSKAHRRHAKTPKGCLFVSWRVMSNDVILLTAAYRGPILQCSSVPCLPSQLLRHLGRTMQNIRTSRLHFC